MSICIEASIIIHNITKLYYGMNLEKNESTCEAFYLVGIKEVIGRVKEIRRKKWNKQNLATIGFCARLT